MKPMVLRALIPTIAALILAAQPQAGGEGNIFRDGDFEARIVLSETPDLSIAGPSLGRQRTGYNASILTTGKKAIMLAKLRGEKKLLVLDRDPLTGDLSNPRLAPQFLNAFDWLRTPTVSLDGTKLAGITTAAGEQLLVVLTREKSSTELEFGNPNVPVRQSMVLLNFTKWRHPASKWGFYGDVEFGPNGQRLYFQSVGRGWASGHDFRLEWNADSRTYGDLSIYFCTQSVFPGRERFPDGSNHAAFVSPRGTPRISPDATELLVFADPGFHLKPKLIAADFGREDRTTNPDAGAGYRPYYLTRARDIIRPILEEDPPFTETPNISPDGKFYQAVIYRQDIGLAIISWPRQTKSVEQK